MTPLDIFNVFWLNPGHVFGCFDEWRQRHCPTLQPLPARVALMLTQQNTTSLENKFRESSPEFSAHLAKQESLSSDRRLGRESRSREVGGGQRVPSFGYTQWATRRRVLVRDPGVQLLPDRPVLSDILTPHVLFTYRVKCEVYVVCKSSDSLLFLPIRIDFPQAVLGGAALPPTVHNTHSQLFS